MGSAYMHSVYALFRQNAAIGGHILFDIHTTVIIGLKSVYPLTGHKSGPAGHTKRRRAIGIFKDRTLVGQPGHIGRLDKRMAVYRRIERIMLVGYEKKRIGHA